VWACVERWKAESLRGELCGGCRLARCFSSRRSFGTLLLATQIKLCRTRPITPLNCVNESIVVRFAANCLAYSAWWPVLSKLEQIISRSSALSDLERACYTLPSWAPDNTLASNRDDHQQRTCTVSCVSLSQPSRSESHTSQEISMHEETHYTCTHPSPPPASRTDHARHCSALVDWAGCKNATTGAKLRKERRLQQTHVCLACLTNTQTSVLHLTCTASTQTLLLVQQQQRQTTTSSARRRTICMTDWSVRALERRQCPTNNHPRKNPRLNCTWQAHTKHNPAQHIWHTMLSRMCCCTLHHHQTTCTQVAHGWGHSYVSLLSLSAACCMQLQPRLPLWMLQTAHMTTPLPPPHKAHQHVAQAACD
jgi:hypothetical protein